MSKGLRITFFVLCSVFFFFTAYCLLFTPSVFAEDLNLQDLIDEALKNNPEIRSAEFRASASKYRIPQVTSLPDPMFMFGYQNEGFKRYTYGKSSDAQWMFSASQMFPFPGKLSLKGEMAASEAESLEAFFKAMRLKTVAKVKELYHDLFLAYKNIELLRDKTAFFSRIEDTALARYSAGMGAQQEVIMAQTEKYMLLEKEEMQNQKIQSIEAMLNTTIGRSVSAPLGRPSAPVYILLSQSLDDLLKIAYENSLEVKSKEKMIVSAEAKVKMAQREYYPDFTLNAGYFRRGGEFEDMWSLTTTLNIPLYYRTKQRQAVLEAEASLSETKNELESTKLMIASAIRDNYSMCKTAEKLMDLYKNGLIPKIYQDFELAIAGYSSGKVEAITVINRLKSVIDFELLYWGQFAEREKAIARLEAIAGIGSQGSVVSSQGDKK